MGLGDAACVAWIDHLMGNNSSRPSAYSQSRYPQDRSFSKPAWPSRRRRIEYGGQQSPYDDRITHDHPHHQAYPSPFPTVQPQAFYGQLPYTPTQPIVFPHPQLHGAPHPVIPPAPMGGAIPTAGNPFPASPINIAIGAQEPFGAMGMPEPVIPGQGQNPEAPVIPPMPSNIYARAGTPYHPGTPYPLDSSDSDDPDDELTPRTRQRLQPPLAPGQYGPFDSARSRRATPGPTLRHGHRRAESSPVFGHNPEGPVIPPPGMYGQPMFPQYPGPGAPMYPQAEPPRREPSPVYRPRPWTPIRYNHNPLPTPPKDIFQSSPYSHLLRELRRPVDEVEIKAKLVSMPAIHTVGAIPVPVLPPGHHQGSRSSRDKKRKGLFRSLSSRLHSRRDEHDEHDTPPQGEMLPQTFVGGQSTAVYPVMQNHPDGTTTLTYFPPGVPIAGGVPPGMPGYVPGVAPAVSPGVVPAAASQQQPYGFNPGAPSPGPMRMPTPQPAPAPPPPPPIRFDRTSAQYSGFMHISPHKVHYQHKSYPTVLHLVEALRFLPEHPQQAEEIRRCGTAEEAAAIAGSMRDIWRPDWDAVFEELLDEVLYNKFIQHARLRALLLETGEAPLVYADPYDGFWGEGEGGRGLNHLGRALGRVRDRLRAEGVDTGY
ncbi:hypothetical protein BC628DRAFT_1348832 [Trametes gibbosa]|nr:hypothetical protein BC628DRAFT_1348832 [Trametes gibbosa]